jgi:hypothetical protein
MVISKLFHNNGLQCVVRVPPEVLEDVLRVKEKYLAGYVKFKYIYVSFRDICNLIYFRGTL